MDDTSLRLDGNALGGMLRELFAMDVTAARAACGGCGAVAMVGALPLYDYPEGPGAVLRCRACEHVLMVVVHTAGRYRISSSGMSWMEIAERQ